MLYSLKTPTNQRLSGVFTGVWNENIGQKWVKMSCACTAFKKIKVDSRHVKSCKFRLPNIPYRNAPWSELVGKISLH